MSDVIKKRNPHAGHRARLRQQVINSTDFCHPHQMLEAMLFAPIRVRDTNVIAHELIDRFGGFKELSEASIEEMTEVRGVGPTTALFLKACFELYQRYAHHDFDCRTFLQSSLESGVFYKTVFSGRGEAVAFTVTDDDGGLIFNSIIDIDESDAEFEKTIEALKTLSRRHIEPRWKIYVCYNSVGRFPDVEEEDIVCMFARSMIRRLDVERRYILRGRRLIRVMT